MGNLNRQLTIDVHVHVGQVTSAALAHQNLFDILHAFNMTDDFRDLPRHNGCGCVQQFAQRRGNQ